MKLFEKNSRGRGDTLPFIPLKDMVLFPKMVMPLVTSRSGSIQAAEKGMTSERLVMIGSQRTPKQEPGESDFFRSGTLAKIIQMMKLPDNSVRVLVEGRERCTITSFQKKGELYQVKYKVIRPSDFLPENIGNLMKAVQQSFRTYASVVRKIPPEAVKLSDSASGPDALADIISAHLPVKIEQKEELLTMADPVSRLEKIVEYLEVETEVQELRKRIAGRVKKKMEKNQRDFILNEQLREIKKEMGSEEDDPSGTGDLERKLKEKELPEQARAKAEKELKRLSKLQPISPEAGILRTYLEWITDLPWTERNRDNSDIQGAAAILDEDHYDMEKPKERILDYIAVRTLSKQLKGPILCFVGPPGTGKTSLGQSLARALGRSFVRISLGGVRDEAEIRGHRKTYVGALPGKIIQSMRKAGTVNPVFLLDEIDKLGADYRGDPSAALLEVLDPEQNKTFTDHYLEVPYDLSDIIFITTANSLHTIPHPLRDRMEIIPLPGYTDMEKTMIARNFIIPKQLKENGLDWADVRFTDEAVKSIIHDYTMESGVRNLEREIAAVIRKVARKVVSLPEEQRDNFAENITPHEVQEYLGKIKFKRDLLHKSERPGLSYGLAWTETGGTVLPVEALVFDGKGGMLLTGSLGDVMKESAQTALSFIKANAREFRLSSDFSKEKEIHIHVPEGAIPKDGPSAGITITAALLSAFSGIPVKDQYAMTGEVTLTGRLLPVGGIKEKVLAAYRNKMKAVVLPEGNRKDMDDIPGEVRESIDFIFTDSVIEGLTKLFPERLTEIRSI
ncbi:MAG: endopeptidase La [Spirochaetia bacterium]